MIETFPLKSHFPDYHPLLILELIKQLKVLADQDQHQVLPLSHLLVVQVPSLLLSISHLLVVQVPSLIVKILLIEMDQNLQFKLVAARVMGLGQSVQVDTGQ